MAMCTLHVCDWQRVCCPEKGYLPCQAPSDIKFQETIGSGGKRAPLPVLGRGGLPVHSLQSWRLWL